MISLIKFKVQMFNVVKLFLLLHLLFLVFTWNIPPDFDSLFKHPHSFRKKAELRVLRNGENTDMLKNCDSYPDESRKSDKSATPSDILIPSFNEWKKKELEEYEKNHAKHNNVHQRQKFIGRKLNYASSKCGAKILLSNPKSRNRMAVLSEKPDEYFLNPCRVTTWFVIELCDSVEVKQIELANYELYSSSPKEFSVFFSEVFPTFMWHHLGTFTAEDKRTMQTFDVGVKNMGKFIKVVIHSHYGKEHYCPLSVIRVLGYSMTQTLGDMENDESHVNSDFCEESVKTYSVGKESIFESVTTSEIKNRFIMKKYEREFCGQVFTQCSNISSPSINHRGSKILTCRFLQEVMTFSYRNCLDFFCPRYPELFLKGFDFSSRLRLKINSSSLILPESENSRLNMNDFIEIKDIIKDYEYKKSLRMKNEKHIYDFDKLGEISKKSNDKTSEYCDVVKTDKNNPDKLDSIKSKFSYGKTSQVSENKCICDKHKNDVEISREMEELLSPQQKEYGDETDSAGLINKESVIYKLTTKIKTSEFNISLINKYLQKLSQSYRQQVEQMKIKFNETFTEMTKASKDATILNEKQEKSIENLKTKIEALNKKIDFLVAGKNNLIKRVFELHGFILILEVIIIATIFNIFKNILHRKNDLYHNIAILKEN